MLNFHYNIHGLVNISSGIFDLSVGTIILLQRRNSRVNQSFFFVSVSAFLWVAGFGLLSLANDSDAAYNWARIAYIGVPLISPTVFIFSQFWAVGKTDRLTKLAIGMAILTIIPPVVFPRHLFTMVDHSWGRYIRVGGSEFAIPFYSGLILVFIVFAILAIQNFFTGWRKNADPLRRIQFRSVFFAFIIAYAGSIDFAVKFGIDLYPSGCLWLSSLIFFIAYTILRHRTLEIDLAQNRFALLALIYSALIAIAIPILIPTIRGLSTLRNNHDAILTILLVGGGALFLSIGPALYAYVAGQQFWLKQHVTSALTHELKSPIGAIRGALDLLRRSIETNPNGSAGYIDMLERNTDRLERFVADLLTILRQGDSGLSARRNRFDISETIQRVATAFSEVAQTNGITIRISSSPELFLFADEGGIEQVLSNLLSNSIKFSNGGNINVTAISVDNNIRIQVTDQGQGIRADDMPHIFDQFFQGKGSAKGSGLGLSIAKGWVEAHGGRIWAESNGNESGSKFTVMIPLI